jgi:hypothetical protein
VDEATLKGYTRAPARLRAGQPSLAQAPDIFGADDRLRAIQAHFEGRPRFETAVDLGGHSGFFSLSLADLGMVGRSTVYDLNADALAAGRSMASDMGLSERVTYVQQAVSLPFLQALGRCDLVICLNLLHHAGARFDEDDVRRRGWDAYLAECLAIFRAKAAAALIGFGFKTSRPLYWDVEKPNRPQRVFDVAVGAGWRVAYDANVDDIHSRGVRDANGLRTSRRKAKTRARIVTDKVVSKLRGRGNDPSKRHNYHLYILE